MTKKVFFSFDKDMHDTISFSCANIGFIDPIEVIVKKSIVCFINIFHLSFDLNNFPYPDDVFETLNGLKNNCNDRYLYARIESKIYKITNIELKKEGDSLLCLCFFQDI